MKVSLLAAISLDGYITRETHELADWTSTVDKKFFRQKTTEIGTIIFGSTTAKTIGRALPNRRTIVYTYHPENLQIEGIETTDLPPADLLEQLEAEGLTEVALCGGAAIYSLFMAADVVTDLYITLEPVAFGTGVKLFNDRLVTSFKLVEQSALDDDILLLHYSVVR